MRFNGSDYIPEIDDKRLSAQHLRIKNLMLDNRWRTLAEISKITNDPETSVSSHLRHLRKPRFGSFVVEKRSRLDRSVGLFEYRVSPPGTKSSHATGERRNKLREALVYVWTHPSTTKEVKEGITKIIKGGKK